MFLFIERNLEVWGIDWAIGWSSRFYYSIIPKEDVGDTTGEPMKITLIISTYNRPDALKICLLSAFQQALLPDEIIVGDDGSDISTRNMIDSLRNMCPTKLIHIWHEDNGFRLAKMRNKCIAAATGDYIVEIDGDIIMHRCFIKDHAYFAEKGFYLRGGRTRLSKKASEKICDQGKLPSLSIFADVYVSKRENSLHIPLIAKVLMNRYRKNSQTVVGCNLSFFRSDAIAVNGYDEYFEGWGGEDFDFARRLRMLGLKKRYLKFAANEFHLWHRENDMCNLSVNGQYCHRDNLSVRCEKGIDQYLKET